MNLLIFTLITIFTILIGLYVCQIKSNNIINPLKIHKCDMSNEQRKFALEYMADMIASRIKNKDKDDNM